jgi:hypothetical protein
LLIVTIGLHAMVRPPVGVTVLDPVRVQAIADELGDTPGSRVMAEWIARSEMRADQQAHQEPAPPPEVDRQ